VNLLGWIVVGFVAGALAKAVTGRMSAQGKWDLGCLGTIVVGVLGGILGGWLFSLGGDEGIGDFGLRSMFVAFVGAVLLLALAALVARRR
jgi:uncharacterized membrane protein YeaQ/YmgE (transglycosylase-associated protein family)